MKGRRIVHWIGLTFVICIFLGVGENKQGVDFDHNLRKKLESDYHPRKIRVSQRGGKRLWARLDLFRKSG